MDINNAQKIRLVVKGIYNGPAAMSNGVITFYFNQGARQSLFDGSIDGVPCNLKVSPIDGYDTVKMPFLQAVQI